MENKLHHSSIEMEQPMDARTLGMQESTLDNENKVLLIEDNPGDARLVEILLRESDLINCSITHRTTLQDGLETLQKENDFDAILLDLSLPDSRGFVTLEELLVQFPDANVIVLTGHDDKALGVKAVKAGAQDFLVKGFFDSELLSKTLRFSIERSSVLKRLEETQHIAHIGNWEYNSTTNIFHASDEVYRIFGFTPRKNIFSAEVLDNSNHPFCIFKEIHELTNSSNQHKLRKDITIKQIDGDTRYVFAQCSISKKSNGSIIYSGIMQDITDRKMTEDKMLKSQERYQNIFSKSKDAIFIANFNGRLVDYNRATAQLTAYSLDELKDLDIQTIFNKESFWKNILEELQTGVSIKDTELEFEDKNGKKTFCLLTASPLEFEDFVGFNCILRDITENKHAEELRKSRDLAKQSAQLKEKFIASISHEMRTPMNAILGMSNLVLKTNGLSEEQYNYINSIKQSSEILLGIVNDILEIATLQNGKIKFENHNFDMHELLANLVNVMVYKLNEKDLAFELSVDKELHQFFKGDKLRLNQILYNLVGNAIKFTDQGKITIAVEKLNESAGSVHVQFMVQDTGIGIPEDKVGAIFETFTRIRTKDRIFEGTGLGLSIAKNLVEYQGGKIWVESKLREGSKFFFDLILETGTDPQNDPKLGSNDIEKVIIDPDMAFNLLLVEDHKMNQLVARKTLERQWKNMNLSIADNGQIALDLLNKKSFDIILMDIQMPIMDGYETTSYIRDKMPPEIASLPILAMTAHAHIAKDEKFREHGMDDFVLKPFEPEQLFYKITKYVKNR